LQKKPIDLMAEGLVSKNSRAGGFEPPTCRRGDHAIYEQKKGIQHFR
jgi:hypothetical protein